MSTLEEDAAQRARISPSVGEDDIDLSLMIIDSFVYVVETRRQFRPS
jgi:hypothetical protein